MRKVSKVYIAAVCTAALLTGCTQVQQTVQKQEVSADAEFSEELKDQDAVDSSEEVKAPEEEEISEIEEERELHPIVEGQIDYLKTDGIHLEPGTEIAMVAANSGTKYWNDLKAGAVQAAADLNASLGYTGKEKVTLSYDAPKNSDMIEQINIIDQFLDKAPDAICVAFLDATASKTQMQMAQNNGIRLLAFDSPDDSRMTEALIATDNKAAATEAADKLYQAINYEGKVAIIVHNSLTQTGQDRKQAAIDHLAAEYNDKNIQFVDIVYLAQEDRTETEILDELLEKNPDLAGIICTDLQTTEMVLDYAASMEEVNFKIVGFDVSDKIMGQIGGLLEGTVAQDPYGIGYATVVATARSLAGMENAESIHADHVWIDASNADSEEVQSLLNH